jgi:hypothetical protein
MQRLLGGHIRYARRHELLTVSYVEYVTGACACRDVVFLRRGIYSVIFELCSMCDGDIQERDRVRRVHRLSAKRNVVCREHAAVQLQLCAWEVLGDRAGELRKLRAR